MENPSPFDVELGEGYIQPQKPSYTKLPTVEEEISKRISQPVTEKQKVVNKKFYGFLRFFFIASIACVLIGGFMFLNLVEDGYFQSTMTQEVNVDPNMTSNTFNNFTFEPKTENQYNHTIINEITCPAAVCNCGEEE